MKKTVEYSLIFDSPVTWSLASEKLSVKEWRAKSAGKGGKHSTWTARPAQGLSSHHRQH